MNASPVKAFSLDNMESLRNTQHQGTAGPTQEGSSNNAGGNQLSGHEISPQSRINKVFNYDSPINRSEGIEKIGTCSESLNQKN